MSEEKRLCREHVERAIDECGRIGTILKRVYPEVDRLTAELAKDDGTPITSVEQVEGLAAGFYELCHINEKTYFATRGRSGWLLNTLPPRFSTGSCSSDAVCSNFTSYKLIRAFEPAAPSIPEGAIENTLENRSKAGKGYYLFHFNDGDNLLFYRGDFEFWHYEGEEYVDASPLMDTANYFQHLDADKFNAALEALAKGER